MYQLAAIETGIRTKGMACIAEQGNIPCEQQSTDLEAAFHLSNHPTASASASSALEEGELNAQSYLRRKPKEKALPETLSWSAPAFFDEVQQHLEDARRQHCLFLCWENGANDQRAVPLLIEDPEDEKRIYQGLRQMWYEGHRWWWKYLPFYGVLGLQEVEFRFLRKHDSKYSIIVDELDVFKIKQRLENELERAENVAGRITDLFCPVPCTENAVDGSWTHENTECLGATEPDILCGFQTCQQCKRNLDRLELSLLPLLCFEDPDKAVDQRTLEGMAQESCIYRTSPRVAEQRFRGLIIHAGLKLKLRGLDTGVVATIIVILWKATGGNWEAAFAAAGFFIMLITLSSALRRRHPDRNQKR